MSYLASEEHFLILKQGVDIWNAWRSNNPETQIDLTGAYLEAVNLTGANLRKANLSGAYLRWSNLREVDFRLANLTDADLVGANLKGANLNGVKLKGAKLKKAYIDKKKYIDYELYQKLDTLLLQLRNQLISDKEETIIKIVELIKASSNQERLCLIDEMPSFLREHKLIIGFLNFIDKVRILERNAEEAYNLLISGSILGWQELMPEAKILCIYKLAKESQSLSKIILLLKNFYNNAQESELTIVRATLKIIWAKENPDRASAAFREAHGLIVKHLIEQAYSSDQPLRLYPLLPLCQSGIAHYCEGKPWQQQPNYAWCLRGKTSCCLSDKNPQESNNFSTGHNFILKSLEGARIYANCSQDWKNWSLLELFAATGVVPQLPGLKHPEEYVPKLSAWVNRINEIRERLKCSVCNQLMPHNVEYSKFSTKFRVTVFGCQQGDNHDKGIYLNECWGWGCHQIIDNRESKFKQEGYYICIHCGSGSPNSNTYTPGDICPKCGSKEGMKKSESNSRERKCPSCNHSIRLPYQVKITDSKVDNNSDRGWEDIEF